MFANVYNLVSYFVLNEAMEKSTRKRKHSNLRVSLGRKSVGDRATFEEVPDTSSNVSCHLNPDSAVIDPDHIGKFQKVFHGSSAINIINED